MVAPCRRAARPRWRGCRRAASTRRRAARSAPVRVATSCARRRAVDGGVGAAVAAERAGVEPQQDQRRAGVRGDRQQRPARAGTVGAGVVEQRAVDREVVRVDAVATRAGEGVRSGDREGALDGREPRGGGVGGRHDERQQRTPERLPAAASRRMASAARKASAAPPASTGTNHTHVVLAVHQHDLREHRAGERARDQRDAQDAAVAGARARRGRAHRRPPSLRWPARARRRSRGGRSPWTGSARPPRPRTSRRARAAWPGAGRVCRATAWPPVPPVRRAGGAAACASGGGAEAPRGRSLGRRSTTTSAARPSRPNSANGRIQAAWSPRPLPNSRSGFGASPNGIGSFSRPLVLRAGCGVAAGSSFTGADAAGGRRGVRTCGGVDDALAGRGDVGAGAHDGMLSGPPAWPSTRPRPLYSKVSPISVLLVELPT